MKRFIEGQNRFQTTLLPESLDGYIAEDDTIRFPDVFVDQLNFVELGFNGAEPSATGRRGYHPAAELAKNPDAMRLRKQLVEHPYGTIKHWMGSTHFLMRRLGNVKTKMSLHVLAYSMKRAINVLGVPAMIVALAVTVTVSSIDVAEKRHV